MTETIEQSLIDSYNGNANVRNSSLVQDWKVKERDVFLGYLKKENVKSLLEIGAGTGKDSLFFKEQGIDTFSTDLSPEMVKLIKDKGLKAKVMNFGHLEFADYHFDSIYALNCLLHVSKENIKSVLNEVKRVMKPSGLFYMGVYGGEYSEGIWEEDPYTPKRFFSFFDDESIKRLLSDLFTIEYFNVVSKEIVGGNFPFQSIILRK
jgi:SAM-dependent methyltransferase